MEDRPVRPCSRKPLSRMEFSLTGIRIYLRLEGGHTIRTHMWRRCRWGGDVDLVWVLQATDLKSQ
jgi:hypothetical protein